MPLIILFLCIPLIEIALFITVGAEIGLGPTLLLCVATAVIGSIVLRQQGLRTLLSARNTVDEGGVPLPEIFDRLCLAVAGAFLLTPGFFTDIIGFALLVPAIRTALRERIGRFIEMKIIGTPPPPRQPDVIEADYERVDDGENDNKP